MKPENVFLAEGNTIKVFIYLLSLITIFVLNPQTQVGDFGLSE